MSEKATSGSAKTRMGIVATVVVVLAFAALILAKAGAGAPVAPSAAGAGAQAPTSPSGPSQSRADASVAYEAALKTGKPVYVLFHSLTCDPCIDISAVVDDVIADYEGKVVFVNAITTDAPAARLAGKFRFQYIPTSFFLDAKGEVVDSFTGAMDQAAMRAYLDKLTTKTSRRFGEKAGRTVS